ncbi:ankyrin repeat and MYND domain-containing protein 1 isoform X1 [Megalobrama amblycephala]|uniref:ankyrin repeat and MYND domain-containing protein 1 isoform X1 n=1 Tax=Megalobrama amblycephala TaxID=75352 RepID=UPI00201471DD|nr:ankyrin repeat and MYND domain-containing protein 1 isoform X1 [Megalobrama amblycephala]
MWGRDIACKRNGHGIQEWTDGCKYEGEFVNNLKHGTGVFTWANGEFYKGSFFKDYRHGKGMYSWPNGSKYTGNFYLNRKEGYGVQVFPDRSTFEGLYHADERFGPGIMTYLDGRQDVGLWHREVLLRICTTLEDGFSLEDFPEHMTRLPKKHLKQHHLAPNVEWSTDGGPLESDQGLSEDEERFILPPDTESYSTDSDHLPIPRCLRRDLDLHFFGRSDISTEQRSPLTALTLQQRMNAHIQRHRFETETLDWDVTAVLNMNRTQFGPKGPLELNSEKLIKEASHGECRNVYRILRDGKVHPDVSDAQGHTALIAATVHCHDDVIHMLLDSGADVNKLNDEGMSALAVCNVLYYPLQSLHETLAEKVTQNISPEPQIKPLEDVSHKSSPDPMTGTPKDESGQETFETPRQTNQVDQSLEPENLNNLEKLEAQEQFIEVINEDQPDQPEGLNNSEEPQVHYQINENTDPNKKIVLHPEHEQDRPSVEPHDIISRSIQVFDGTIAVGSVLWQERKTKSVVDSEEEVTNLEFEEKLERSIRSDDLSFDSACSLASFHIDVTEEILQKSAEILCQTGTVTPTDTQETVRKIALLKTEHRNRWITINLLLERGADPNASTVPMPVIFLAIKAAHVKGVRRLLECGARTDIPLLPEQRGLYPLHIAAGLPGAEGPEITQLLLHALADPDVKAQDANEVYEFDKNTFEHQAFENQHFMASRPLAKFNEAPIEFPQEGGRTPLHVACQRDSDYANARDVVALLLSHKASPNDVWSGHSPLSLAIASGNDLAVDELLAGGADPNLPLTRHVGSALCALANINYNHGPHPRNQVKLLEKLIKSGADILMPVVVGEGSRCAVGTVVDYAHCAFQQNQRMAHTPYHALNKCERQAYNARRQLLGLMGDLLRQAAIRMETCRMEKERSQGVLSASPSEKFVYTGAGATPSLLSSPEQNSKTSFNKCIGQRVQRKPRFKYCYQCGRSVGVQLMPCSRCHEVFYCSKTCKTNAWDERHRDECVRLPVVSGKSSRDKRASVGPRSPVSTKEAKDKTFHLSVTPEIQEYDLNENYSFI